MGAGHFSPMRSDAVHGVQNNGLYTKQSLALRQFALGMEGLERFVHREPLRRQHEYVFGALAPTRDGGKRGRVWGTCGPLGGHPAAPMNGLPLAGPCDSNSCPGDSESVGDHVAADAVAGSASPSVSASRTIKSTASSGIRSVPPRASPPLLHTRRPKPGSNSRQARRAAHAEAGGNVQHKRSRYPSWGRATVGADEMR